MNHNLFSVGIRFSAGEAFSERQCWVELTKRISAELAAGTELNGILLDQTDGRFYICIIADVPFGTAKDIVEHLLYDPSMRAVLPFYRPILQNNRVFPLTDAETLGTVREDGTVEAAGDLLASLKFCGAEMDLKKAKKALLVTSGDIRTEMAALEGKYPEGINIYPLQVPKSDEDAAELYCRLLEGEYIRFAFNGESRTLMRLADDTILLTGECLKTDAETLLDALKQAGHSRFAVFSSRLKDLHLPEGTVLEVHDPSDSDFYEKAGIKRILHHVDCVLARGTVPEEIKRVSGRLLREKN